jgi:hypothetical protein
MPTGARADGKHQYVSELFGCPHCTAAIVEQLTDGQARIGVSAAPTAETSFEWPTLTKDVHTERACCVAVDPFRLEAFFVHPVSSSAENFLGLKDKQLPDGTGNRPPIKTVKEIGRGSFTPRPAQVCRKQKRPDCNAY